MNRLLNKSIKNIYNKILRPRLPRKIGVYNGVTSRAPRLLDNTDIQPKFKSAYINGIRETVKAGDVVVEVGGGYGISAVVAAQCIGDEGEVISYEPALQHAEIVREAARLNNVTPRVRVREQIVETDIEIWGEHNHDVISARELPACDVLVMDCEGAEEAILDELQQTPRVIVVELHPRKGVDVGAVRDGLERAGYSLRQGDNPTGGKNPVVTAVMEGDDG